MTPALLLWISLMYLLLDGSLGFQIAKDGSFRPSLSDLNLEEDNDLDFKFDEGESSANQQSSYIYTGLYVPPGSPSPNSNVDFDQNVPNSIWQPSVQYPPVTAEPPSFAQSGTVVWVVQGNEVGQPAVQHPPVNAESPSSAPSGTAVWSVQGNQVGQPSVQYSPVNAQSQSSAVSIGQGNEIWQPPFQYPPAGSKPLGTPSSNVMWSETNEIDKPLIQYPPVNAKPPGSAVSGPAVWSAQGNQVRQPTVQYPPVNAGPQMPPVAFVQGNAKPPGSAVSPAVWSVQGNQVRQPTVQYPPVNAGPQMPPVAFVQGNAKPPGSAVSGPAVWSVQGNKVRQPTVQYPPVNAGPQMPPVQAFVQGNEFESSTRHASPPSKLSPQRSKGWLDFVFSNSFGDEDFDKMDFKPHNSVMETETMWVPAIAEEPLPLPQKPRPYIVHSKNGYKRGRVVHTKTFYSNDYKQPKIIEKVKSAKKKL